MVAQRPTVSIIMPTRNRSRLTAEAIASVIAQTESKWELLVCDDQSNDDTRAIVGQFAQEDPRIRFLPAEGLSGACARRNQGIAAARGVYVIFLDSDDLLAPHCLSQRIDAMERRPELGFGVFPCQVFRQTAGDTNLLWNADSGEDDIERFLRKDIPWQTTSAIWRRAALDQVGPWDEQAKAGQDWDFHLRALVRGVPYARFPGPDCYWRVPDPQRQSIGNSAPAPDHMRHRVAMISRIHQMLAETGQLTPRRRVLLAGQFFFVASSLTAKAAREDGFAAWRRAQQLGLLGPGQYVQGWLYLRVWHRKGFREPMRRWLERSWPGEMFLGLSPTHMNTPLPATSDPVVQEL